MSSFRFLIQLMRDRRSLRPLLASGNYQLIRDYPPGHFYSPVPHINEIKGAAQPRAQDVAGIEGIDIREQSQLAMLETLSATRASELPSKAAPGFRYYFDNPFFSFGDGIVLSAMLRHLRPKRVVEVGSGFSSAAMLDVNERYLSGQTAFTFIDPNPERLLSLLTPADHTRATVVASKVQDVPLSTFTALEAGDILFIDSSHVAKAGSDVMHLFFHVLPRLQPGVVIHVHDILWPFEYPASWLLGGRIWNEAYLLRAFLQFNSAFEILFFNSYMENRHHSRLASKLPEMIKKPSFEDTVGNSSLWLRRM
jgi:predicted O-methyltransferase YrrM